MDTVAFARAYSAAGFQPVLVKANDKKPLLSGWQSTPLEAIVEGLELNPTANLGVALPKGLIALDIDNKNGRLGSETLSSLEAKHGSLPTTLTQRTPNNGEHRIYRLRPGVVLKNRVAIAPGLDVRTKGGMIVVQPSMINGRRYHFLNWDVLREASPPVENAPGWLIELVQSRSQSEEAPFRVANDQVPEGRRNDWLFRKACALRQNGLDADEIDAALQKINLRVCEPPLPQEEVNTIAKSAANYSPETGMFDMVDNTGFRLLSTQDLHALPRLEWVIKGVVPRVGVGAIYGPSGAGKSFLAIDMATALAAGTTWFGRRVKPTSVVYCALEGEAGIIQRVDAYRKVFGDISDQMRFVLQPFNLLDDTQVESLAMAAKAAGAAGGVIFLDTLNRATPSCDENDSKDMGRIIAATKYLQQRVGGLVILVHHTGKDASKGLRGHSSLQGALDFAIEVTQRSVSRAWSLAKSKEGVDGVAHEFALEHVSLEPDEDGEPVTSCIVRPAAPNSVASLRVNHPKGGNQMIVYGRVLELLRFSMPDLETQPEGIPLGQSYIKFEEAVEGIRDSLTCQPDQRGRSTRNALTGLINRGLLVKQGEWLFEPPR